MTAGLRLTLTAAFATALASVGLGVLFVEGSPWAAWALAGIAGSLAGVLLGRALRLPEALVTLAGAAGLSVVACLSAARDSAVLGLLPGPAALADLRRTLLSGQEDVVELVVPVPPTPGLLLITLLGVGLAALLVDLLAAGLSRPAVAGVPLLALLVVPGSLVPGGVGWLPFSLAACGWFALLLTDAPGRAKRWGRLAAGPQAAGRAGALAAGHDPRGHTGRRIGVAALGVALVVPAVVPASVQGRLDLGDGWGGFGGVGSASVDTYNPIVRLKGELTRPEARPVLLVRTDQPDYLRLTALDLYDGATWSQSPLTAPRSQRVAEGVPLPPGLPAAATRAVTATVEVLDLSTRWLPVHYPPRVVDVEGDWRYDAPSRTVFSSRDETTELPPYSVTSSRVDLDPTNLDGTGRPDDALAHYLELPVLPPVVQQLAEQLTAEADNPYERAVALQQWFRESGGFVYDEEVPEGNSGSDLVDFLTLKRGYCEQFAAAMAVMARAVGLPSRVAIGYTAGQEVEPGVWEVSSHDAHAWPEVNLPGAGWIRFEPTPRDDGASPAPPYSVPPAPVEPAPAPQVPAPAPTAPTTAPQLPQGGFTGGGAPETVVEESGRGALVAVGLVALVALAATPAAVHALRLRWAWEPRAPRRRRGVPPGAVPPPRSAPGAVAGGSVTAAVPVGPALARRRAEVAWRQVQEQASDLGLPWRDSDAPRAAADRLVRAGSLSGEAMSAVGRLAVAVEAARYSPRPPSDEGLRGDARLVRAGLRAGASRGARLRALLLPVSTLRAAGRVIGTRVADALDLLDGLGPRLSQLVTRRREQPAAR